MAIQIQHIGLSAIIVDAGRRGVLHQGFCQSGPMDARAFELANRLCGQTNAPTVEIMGECTLFVEQDCYLSVTGPAATLLIDNQQTDCWQRFAVNANSIVHIRPERLGTRHYVAVPSGFAVDAIVGSASTVKRENMGGLHKDGSSIRVGDTLNVKAISAGLSLNSPASLPAHLIPKYDSPALIGIVPGYQHQAFSTLTWRRLLSSEYDVTPQMDRMGVRLKGPEVKSIVSTLYSEAIAAGSVQVPPDGQPIVMMADRQTLGGYPKMGAVARCDLYRFAQCLPGDKIQFYQLDAANARATWLLQQSSIARWFGN
ncbi:biotin-dependent carboxyltransferase family protein [Alteromonas sp. AMM-1]|uniref:5-oxoprolinase subunit C family protein n=1 Tax=Alteromonas sp. AMM-1 TaxID=3394233 RepID=UPI0039A48C87